MRNDPELVRRRLKIQKGTKSWDKVWLGFYLPAFFSLLAVAGLDSGRYQWSEAPLWGIWLGSVVYALSLAITFWAMATNTHFEGTVRIQTDRSHKVIDKGPYKNVRHPGYVAFILTGISIPALLASLYAYIPAAIVTILFVIRTALEDRTLKEELEGYRQYAHSVQYRLVPGIW